MKTSALITSLEGVCKCDVPFPVLAIPFGAERYDTPCRVFKTASEVTEDALKELIANALPLGGEPAIHFLHRKGGFWENHGPEPLFVS